MEPTRQYENPFASLKRADFFLLGCIALIVIIGWCFVIARQTLFISIGVAIFVALQKTPYLLILRYAPLLYLIGLLLLCGVFATRPINGAHSWYNLYFFNLQPSELMKPIIILTLAHYLMYRDSYKRLTGLLAPLGSGNK